VTDTAAPPIGVGQTAIFVALLRQQESQRSDALFHDPFAQALLDALASDPALGEVSEVIRQTHRSARGFPEYFAVRTRFFDDALGAALAGGIRQVVTLAAGLDGRTLRLPCPAGTRWYELDLPDMTGFKDRVIRGSGLASTCQRVGVGCDLTGDWRSALTEAGFDASVPTAWLVEGLLMYLSPSDGDALLGGLTTLSAPGSRLNLEHLKALMLAEEGRAARERVESQGAAWLAARDDIDEWLAGWGWHAQVYSGDDDRITYGRKVAPLPAGWLADATFTP
jgi:methyltransferase (TIGR00027 family)